MADAPITPIVVPLWLGTERHGTDLGARALHRALREHWTPARVGPLASRLGPAVEIACPVPADAERRIDHRALAFREPILATAREHACVVRDALANGSLALSIGGDHALAFGSLAGAAWADGRAGVLWIDTHPDLNTPCTSPSGHMHGMPLATAIGTDGCALPELEAMVGRSPMIDPANVALLGVRDIDPGEREMIHRLGIWALPMEEWHDTGIAAGLERALGHLAARGVTSVHVSFDLDVLDPSVLPGTGTKAPGGLSYREASQMLRRLGTWDGPVRSLDMVELNPRLDPSGSSTRAAGLLLATALGMRQLPAWD
jgi:arginase